MGIKKAPKISTKLHPNAIKVLAATIQHPGITQASIGEKVGLTSRQVGEIQRSPEFRIALYEALDVPEDMVRKAAPTGIQYLYYLVLKGSPRKLADGSIEAPSDDDINRAAKAAAKLADLAIGQKIKVEPGQGGGSVTIEWVPPSK